MWEWENMKMGKSEQTRENILQKPYSASFFTQTAFEILLGEKNALKFVDNNYYLCESGVENGKKPDSHYLHT